MAVFQHTCPHCSTVDIGLRIVQVASMRTPTGGIAPGHAIVFLVCPRCDMPSSAHLIDRLHGRRGANLIKESAGDPLIEGWEVEGFWPATPAPQVPDLLPPDVVRVYLQAEDNYNRHGNEEAAGIMYRKALDIGVKKVDPKLSGMLGAKLKALVKSGKLTPEFGDWADHVKSLGNDAAHEEAPISREDLADLRGLTEMVMRYLFTLPNMVRKRRGEPLPWETP